VDLIRAKIINFTQSRDIEDYAIYTLESWFQFAEKFWQFTKAYTGLTDFKTLEERNEESFLSDFVKKLIGENFEDS
jgi:hypothetical protein